MALSVYENVNLIEVCEVGTVFDIQHSTFDIQYSTFDIRHSTFDIRHLTFDIRHSNVFNFCLIQSRPRVVT